MAPEPDSSLSYAFSKEKSYIPLQLLYIPLFPGFCSAALHKRGIQSWFWSFLNEKICHKILSDTENLIYSAINCTCYVLSKAKEQTCWLTC